MDTTSFDNSAMAGGMLATMGMSFMIGFGIIFLLLIISMWKIYAKAGKPGWACLIPIYNYIVLLQIVGKPWWWLFLLLIPIVNIVIAIIIIHKLSVSFGHGAGFTIGLLILGVFFYPILAFGSSKYVGPGGQAATA